MEQSVEKTLSNKKLKAIEMLVYDITKANIDITRELNINESTLYRWFKDASFSKRLKEEQIKYLEVLGSRAIKKINKLAESEDIPASVQYQAAKDIADRGGFKPVEKIEQTVDIPSFVFNIVPVEPNKSN